jgi:hypothetical protein
VADVARSIAWYACVLGASADPFPDSPPYSFAILRRDNVEIMLQCAGEDIAKPPTAPIRPQIGWSVYLRLEGGRLLALAEAVQPHTPLLRGPERMFYGQVEFEVSDPDGHRLCIAEALPVSAKVPAATE